MSSVTSRLVGSLGTLISTTKEDETPPGNTGKSTDVDGEQQPQSPAPVPDKSDKVQPERRPSIARLPSQVIESDDSASLLSTSPPTVSISSSTNASHESSLSSRTSTIELDGDDGFSSTATAPLSKHSLSAPQSTSGGSSSPSTGEGYQRHRRGWSQSMPKEVKETHDATSTEDAETGFRKLNQYELGEELGKGSFGYVWKAVDSLTGQEYAIKELSKSRLRRHAQAASMRAARRRDRRSPTPLPEVKSGLRLIEHEVAIHKKLRHVNVLALREVIDDRASDSIYMVLELCRGGPIMHVNPMEAVEPLPDLVARSYFRQVLLALEYLHHLDICHQDIKPENILLSGCALQEHDLVKLCDFGVSQLFAKRGDDLSSRNAGSPAFLSPEQNISQHGQLHLRASDIWWILFSRRLNRSLMLTTLPRSLGVTLYAMLTGRLPFRSNNAVEMAELIKSEPAIIPRALSAHARDLLAKMLEKDPEARIGIDEIRVHPWTTEEGAVPLPSIEENCSPIEEPSSEEVEHAIRSLSTVASAVKIAQRIKRLAMARRAASSDGRRASDEPVENDTASSSTASHRDDEHVDSVRFVEDQTGVEFTRSEELSAARGKNRSSTSSPASASVSASGGQNMDSAHST